MDKTQEILAIASKRGLFFPTAELYGGKAGFYTYGHLGKLLKNNFEQLWRDYFLNLDDNFYEIQSNNILPEKVFIASGHVKNFNEIMRECKKCHSRFKADDVKSKCMKCGGELTEGRTFNMMFKVPIGFAGETGYLSPETAQGAYISFKNEFQATRNKLPLGLAIIDKAYRNEISPRQKFFRLREFTQAELQIFFDPANLDEIDDELWNSIKSYKLIVKRNEKKKEEEISLDEINKKMKIGKFYLHYAAKVQQFYLDVLKIPKEKFRLREIGEKERAFYNKIHFDIEINLETFGGFNEIGGIHYRTDHDLKGHENISKESQEIFHNNKRFIPHVLELSFGIDRNIWALLDLFYDNEKKKNETYVFRFPSQLAPFQIAILPLVNKDGIDNLAAKVHNELKKNFHSTYDDSGSIGRRYARNDEIGTPFCITIDGESRKDNSATIRDRDTTEQFRVKISELKDTISKVFKGESLIKFGKKVDTRKM
ncbi:glycine--tRNA ligase [Candidatus Pacearchaeota archaeon]|nr:glycine--tRNA ligase [Candidatus Pacearchaeota archaeon]